MCFEDCRGVGLGVFIVGNLQVIAAPFATGFNHLKIANEIYYKLDRCQTRIFGRSDLPVYGVGHSMGSLMHVLIATQYPAQKAGRSNPF